MIALCVLFLCCSGLAALALSLGRHHGAIFGHPPQVAHPTWYRATGWSLLAAALSLLIAASGPAIGAVSWCGIVMVAVWGIALTLTYRPGLIISAGAAAIPIGLCLAVIEGVR